MNIEIWKNKLYFSLIIYLILQLVYCAFIYYFFGKDIFKKIYIGAVILTVYTLLVFVPVFVYDYKNFENIKQFFKNINKNKIILLILLSYTFVIIYVLIAILIFNGKLLPEEVTHYLNDYFREQHITISVLDLAIIELFFMPITAFIYFLIFLGLWIFCFEIIYKKIKNKILTELTISFIIFYFYLLLIILFDYFLIINNKTLVIFQFLVIAILYTLLGFFIRKYFESGFLAGLFLSLIFSAENVAQFLVFHKKIYFLTITSISLFILYIIILIGATIYKRKVMKILTTEKR